MHRRARARFGGAALLAACGLLFGSSASASGLIPLIEFAGYAIQSEQIDGQSNKFGGISGLDYDQASGLFWAITDARNTPQQGPPRAYSFHIKAGTDGNNSGNYHLETIEQHLLLSPQGTAFAPGTASAEAIRLAPEGGFYWASEGDCGISQPTLWRNALGIAASQPLPIRADYLYPGKCVRKPAAGLSGARDNGALEGLALSPDGKTLYYVNEYPLLQDANGLGSTQQAVRLTAMPALGGDGPVSQYAYFLPQPSGVTEIATLGPGRFLVLEREFFQPESATVARVALADLTDATDIASTGAAPLDSNALVPVQRQELLVLNSQKINNADANLFGSGAPMDNLEGMAVGCVGDKTMLVLVADDNFDKHGPQNNLFLLFHISGVADACAPPPR